MRKRMSRIGGEDENNLSISDPFIVFRTETADNAVMLNAYTVARVRKETERERGRERRLSR